jgi:hypothetical protein
MCGLQSLANLERDRHRFIDLERSACDAVSERFAFDELEDEEARSGFVFEVVDGADA